MSKAMFLFLKKAGTEKLNFFLSQSSGQRSGWEREWGSCVWRWTI